MQNTIPEIDKIHDKIFKKTFLDKKNTCDFLKRVLPQEIKERLDFSSIRIDPTNYVSDGFKEGYSDIVVKVKIKYAQAPGKGKGRRKIIPTDIYFIMEHKSEGRVTIFIQILKYLVFAWEQDILAKRPLRLIIPVVFYHGQEEWTVPTSFVEQFEVDEELKRFLLDFRYILFDTGPWDFRAESNLELKENVYLFTTMVLMKAAFKNDMAALLEIFKFWYEKGFLDNKEMVLFFLVYISQTQEIDPEKLKKILAESKIDGGDMMQTLAQQLVSEYKKDWILQEKRETARLMLLDNCSIEKVKKYTGLTEEEIKSLMS